MRARRPLPVAGRTGNAWAFAGSEWSLPCGVLGVSGADAPTPGSRRGARVDGRVYFSAPAVRPSSTFRWNTTYTISTGSIEMTRPANIWATEFADVS